jgi:hypothetical protein
MSRFAAPPTSPLPTLRVGPLPLPPEGRRGAPTPLSCTAGEGVAPRITVRGEAGEGLGRPDG